MSRYVRKLINKNWLDKEIVSNNEWLAPDSILADALKNFSSSENELSVFLLENDDQIELILSAIVASSKSFDNTDYVIIDHSLIDELDIAIEEYPGKTFNNSVNKLHLNLKQLSAEKVIKLARAVQEQGQIGRVGKTRIAAALQRQIIEGHLNENQLTEEVRAKVKKFQT